MVVTDGAISEKGRCEMTKEAKFLHVILLETNDRMEKYKLSF